MLSTYVTNLVMCILSQIPTEYNTWVYNLSDSPSTLTITSGDSGSPQEVPPLHIALLSPGAPGTPGSIKIRAGEDANAKFIIGGGRPFGRPVYKMLGHDGALFGVSEEHVRGLMRTFEEERLEFGKK
jgi:hypothetical protein